jgi:hypothetical protein
MKKTSAMAQKKDVKTVENVKRRPAKRTTSKQVEAVTAVEEVPEIIEQPAEQPLAQQAADAVAVTPPPESVVLQDSTELITVAAVEKSAKITGLPPEPQTNNSVIVTIPKESKVLRERLGLNGYITETIKLASSIDILGCKAEGVVFAKRIAGNDSAEIDRVLLHVTLVSATGKRSIVSSRKRVPLPEWQTLAEALTGMSITWRDKELKRAAK